MLSAVESAGSFSLAIVCNATAGGRKKKKGESCTGVLEVLNAGFLYDSDRSQAEKTVRRNQVNAQIEDEVGGVEVCDAMRVDQLHLERVLALGAGCQGNQGLACAESCQRALFSR